MGYLKKTSFGMPYVEDGGGDSYSCYHPEKWIWMLHSGWSIDYTYIVPKSKMLILSDYFRF
jgi:hypothetical protein